MCRQYRSEEEQEDFIQKGLNIKLPHAEGREIASATEGAGKKRVRLSLRRLLPENDGKDLLIVTQEPSETLGAWNHLVVPVDQEVEVTIDEGLARQLYIQVP
jgi:hypothetical protein